MSEHVTNEGYDLGAVELDVRHELRMGETAHPVLEVEARRLERGEGVGDLARHGLRRADMEGTVGPDVLVERLSRRDPESAFFGDS